jgi:hypothetical protein
MSDNVMKHNDLSIMIAGAGAIGGITAALLKKNSGFESFNDWHST